MRLSVVIVTHNRRDTLVSTLGKLRDNPHLPHGAMEALVVDNGSTDGAPDAVEAFAAGKSNQPQPPFAVRVIRRPRNEGVAARNHAFAVASGKHIALIDDDSYPLDDALGRAMARMDEAPEIGAVGGRVLLADGSFEASAFPSVMINCAVCIRKAAIDQVGGFPEDFFRQAEEYDLSFRLWNAGFRIERYEDLLFRHEKAAGNRTPAAIHRLDTRNNLILLDRYLTGPLRAEYRADWMQRYEAIARHAGHARAVWLGRLQADVRSATAFIRGQRREPLSPAALEANFELERQARLVAAWAKLHGVRRVALADFSKNIYATFNACRLAGVEIVCLAENGPAFAGEKYRGLPILTDEAAAREPVDGVVLANVSPARVELRARQLEGRFARPVLRLWQPVLLGEPAASAAPPVRGVEVAA
ncbi:MAG: glycosyltransferase [Planctomycetota bacterium]|nr:glycosyltransferase [Planctomycetota bacterium]